MTKESKNKRKGLENKPIEGAGEENISTFPIRSISLSSLFPKARSSITQSNILIIQLGTNHLPVHYPFLSKGESESRITNLSELVDGGAGPARRGSIEESFGLINWRII